MSLVYDMLEYVKNHIYTVYNSKESTFRPVIGIAEKHAKGRLATPLHFTPTFSIPIYYRGRAVKENRSVKSALLKFMSSFQKKKIRLRLVVRGSWHMRIKRDQLEWNGYEILHEFQWHQ